MRHPEYYTGYDISCLKAIGTGGSPTSAKQFLDYMKAFPNVHVVGGYGMTETGGLILNFVPQDMNDLTILKRVCVGKPIPGFKYKVSYYIKKIIVGHLIKELYFFIAC